MKDLKTLTLVIAIIATVMSCKKENIYNQPNNIKNFGNFKNNIESYSNKELKMTFEGKQYFYTVSYDANTQKNSFSGKDAQQVISITSKYSNESVALFTTENEFTFFKNKNDYYSEVFKNMISKNNGNRLEPSFNTNSTTSIVSLQLVSATFYNNVSYTNEFFTQQINNFTSLGGSIFPDTATSPNNITAPPLQSFVFYQRKNDGTDNYQPTGTAINAPGIKNTYVGSAANDKISSFKTQNLVVELNNPTTGYTFGNNIIAYNKVNVILFENQNFGGWATAFNGALSNTYHIEIASLAIFRSYYNVVNGVTATNDWDNLVSSYQLFLSL